MEGWGEVGNLCGGKGGEEIRHGRKKMGGGGGGRKGHKKMAGVDVRSWRAVREFP